MRFSLRSAALVVVALLAVVGTGYAATSGVGARSSDRSTVAPPTHEPSKDRHRPTRTVRRRVCNDNGCHTVRVEQTRVCRKVTVRHRRHGRIVRRRVTRCSWVDSRDQRSQHGREKHHAGGRR